MVLNDGRVRARPDIVFPRSKLAVFIDGCFWHLCPVHGKIPSSNTEYWVPKLTGNVRRDRATTAAMQEAGWKVLRFWEHELPQDTAERIVAVLNEGVRQRAAR